MAKRMNKIEFSYFFCPKCGQKVMELPRPRSLQREAFHRKKLYCYHCEKIFNCVECHNDLEVIEFKEDYEFGVYINDCQSFEEGLVND